MVKRWREQEPRKGKDPIVHVEGHDGQGRTLCGIALEGTADYEEEIPPLKPTALVIDCADCIAIVAYCNTVRASEVVTMQRKRSHTR